jgi:hypothetical protein
MRAFVAMGSAIIVGLILCSIYAEYCTTCCNGVPCNPELIQPNQVRDPVDWNKAMCRMPRYYYLDQCRKEAEASSFENEELNYVKGTSPP